MRCSFRAINSLSRDDPKPATAAIFRAQPLAYSVSGESKRFYVIGTSWLSHMRSTPPKLSLTQPGRRSRLVSVMDEVAICVWGLFDFAPNWRPLLAQHAAGLWPPLFFPARLVSGWVVSRASFSTPCKYLSSI